MARADFNNQDFIPPGRRKWMDDLPSIRTGLSNSVVVVVEPTNTPTDYPHLPKTTLHIWLILLGVLAALREAGYDAFVAHPESVRGEGAQWIVTQRPKGIILLSHILQEESGNSSAKPCRRGAYPRLCTGIWAPSRQTHKPWRLWIRWHRTRRLARIC